jgi:hypothetical protein
MRNKARHVSVAFAVGELLCWQDQPLNNPLNKSSMHPKQIASIEFEEHLRQIFDVKGLKSQLFSGNLQTAIHL